MDGVEHAFDRDTVDNGTLVERLPVSTPPFIYVIPTAPRTTAVCALCGQGNSTVRTSPRQPVPDTAAASHTPSLLQDSSPAAEVAALFAQTVQLVPGGGCPAWDATDECCAPDRSPHEPTDVEFARRTLRAVQDAYRVDVRRQYAMGIGNGGFMALRLACEMPSELAAVASFGSAGAGRVEACRPDAPTHVLEIHAAGDLFVRYEGALNMEGNRCGSQTPCSHRDSRRCQRARLLSRVKCAPTAFFCGRYPGAVTTTRRFARTNNCSDLDTPTLSRFHLPAYARYGADVQGRAAHPRSPPSRLR